MVDSGDFDALRQLAETHQELAQLDLEQSNAVDALKRVDGDALKASEREKELVAQIDAAKLAGRQLDGELHQLDQKIERLRGNLDSAASQAAMDASQRELSLKTVAREELESKGLEALENQEQLETELSKTRERVKSLALQMDDVRKKLESLKSGQIAPREALEKRLESRLNALESDTREAYIALIEQHGHSGLCAVRGDTCPGCDMQLTGALALQLKKGGVWIRCSGCSRILLSLGVPAAG